MSERKVLNKYYPPDFDPTLIPRLRLGRDRQYKVRLMAPFSMRCNTCGHWIGAHTKFNARKETVKNEKFHSMEIYRFYIRCPKCAAEITFKTDPENLDYVCENGASRNFEPWRGAQDANDEKKKEKEEEEEENPLKALENRTAESKLEMEVLDALDEIRTKNSIQERTTVDKAIQNIVDQKSESIIKTIQLQNEKDEELVKSLFQDADGQRIKRLTESDESNDNKKSKLSFSNDPLVSKTSDPKNYMFKKSAISPLSKLGVIVKPKQSPLSKTLNTALKENLKPIGKSPVSNPDPEPDLINNIVGDYGSDSSE
ncbi:Coiled-coil domain-containing protein 94 [Smittium mucronatum]|uniref:Splicing factor YJU2 n=1 Tax=Smittium mucronatum TaxID=133383 RepID=A0A1R0GWD2_9FUNG|nr:Coiled-coil domain-containing protein 94 [Smittium mucronatum]